MPVDRSLLPPLPGKPDWYVEGAARAAAEDAAAAVAERSGSAVIEHRRPEPEPTGPVTNYTTGSAVPAGNPPAGRDSLSRGREPKRLLAGLFRH